MEPTIVEISHDAPIVKEELFVPILHLIKCKVFNFPNKEQIFQNLDEGIAFNNEVPQGLSSSLFTQSHEAIFKWIGYVVYCFPLISEGPMGLTVAL